MANWLDESESVDTKPIMGKSFENFLSIKEYRKPLIFKLVGNPNIRDEDGKPTKAFIVRKFWYDVIKDGKVVLKNGKPLRLPRPSRTLIGDKDPQGDKVAELRANLKELKKSPEVNAAKIASVENALKKFGAAMTGVVLIVQQGKDVIEALELPMTAIDGLFGKAAFDGKEAEPGLFATMKKDEMNPFNLKDPMGWVSVTKTGTTWNDTKYVVEAATVSGGRGIRKPVEHAIDVEALTAKYSDPSKLPDVRKIATQGMWEIDEIEEFIRSGGKTIPAHALKVKGDSEGDVVVETMEEAAPTAQRKTATTAQVDANELDELLLAGL